MNRKWAKLTIKEPFPVFYSHINQKCRKANDPETEGPFYAAGSSWYDFPEKRADMERQAEHLRKDGYTVSVEIEERA